jgi:4-hydroxythreonine-4-phosphate dehydrogenase
MIKRLPVVVSCGEPAGVGLEIAHTAFNALRGEVPMVLLADRRHVAGKVTEVTCVDQVTGNETALPLLHHDFSGDATPGKPDPRNAQGVIDVIARGVDLVRKGEAAALCTLPIHKKALKDGANFAYPGHTEYLAALAGVERVVMMLACSGLRVVPVTIHIAVAEVPDALTPELLEDTLRITQAALIRDFGIAKPRLAVAGLNPHAGEGGAMGTEEITMISPLLERMSQDGMRLSGPMSADTMFHAQARERYDAAVCMYHDQALIPIKTIDFAGGVNVTLGLPFIRTSPDHGTAFDIAGKGIADPTSTIAALRMAWDMAVKRQ